MRNKIVCYLEEGGYQTREVPLYIASHPYKFDGAFSGPRGRNELVLLVDGSQIAAIVLARRMESLSLAMRRNEQSRPVSLICFDTQGWTDDDRSLLTSICRAFFLTPEDDLSVLSALRPLQLPPKIEEQTPAIARLREKLGNTNPEIVNQLLRAARKDQHAVTRVFLERIEAICRGETDD